MNVVPTLDQLAADPAKAQGLPRAALLALAAKALAVHGAVTTALIAGGGGEPADTEDRLISAGELAKLMGRGVNYVYAHKDEWPFTIRGDEGSRPRFSLAGYRRWLAQQDGRAVPSGRASAQRGA